MAKIKTNQIFFLEVFNKLENNIIINWILCGDWNLVLHQTMDTFDI